MENVLQQEDFNDQVKKRYIGITSSYFCIKIQALLTAKNPQPGVLEAGFSHFSQRIE